MDDYSIAWLLSGVASLASVLLLMWNRRLRREVLRHFRTEEALRSSEARFHDLIEHIPGAVYRCALDVHWTVHFLSEGIYTLSGYPASDFIGNRVRSYASLIEPEDRELVDQCVREAIRAQQPYVLEYRIRHADGGIRWVYERGRAVFDAQGTVLYLAGALLDITERKRLQDAVEKKRALYSALFNTNNAIKLLIDPNDGRILDANQAACAFYGYSREELLRLHIHQINTLSPAEVAAEMARARARNKQYFVFPHRLANGEIRTVEVYSGPVELDGRQLLFSIIHDITDRERAEQALREHRQKLEWLTRYDPLTTLPNRTLLMERLQSAIAQADCTGLLLAVCYLDLDGFKRINEMLGHELGNSLLIEVAQRLRNALRGGDTIARLGGDEFVLLIGDLNTQEQCAQAVTRLLRVLSAPYLIADRNIRITASIGVALYPLDRQQPDELIRAADQAMYVAKQSGRNCYQMFDTENDRRVRARRATLERVEQALRCSEFCLYYQPQVDMRQGTVIGAEALIRWRHPERGLVSPGEFLPEIEETPLIIEVGNWVLAEALRQASIWSQQGLKLPVSVNIAARHLQHPDFLSRLTDLLAAHPILTPDQLELEILETTAVEDMELANRVIGECRRMGVHVALDDFGAGYSSLIYFKKLSVDLLKIDQSFVRDVLDDPDDLTIVAGIISLAEAFQRQVIAEGVETIEHGLFLLQLGCDLAQGYGIARPMPADAVLGWVRRFQPDPSWNQVRHQRWSREDFPLLAAGVEHRRWLNKLIGWLRHNRSESWPTLVLDERECRFGIWYHGLGTSLYSHLEGFRELGQAHSALHRLGQQLFEQSRHSSEEALDAQLAKLHQLSKHLLEQLHRVQWQVSYSDCRANSSVCVRSIRSR